MLKPERLNPNCDPAALEQLHQTLLRVSDLSAEAWADGRTCFYEYRMDSGEFSLHAGDTARYSGFVLSGILREFFTTLEGQEFNKNFSLAGDFTGSLFDLITGEPSTASIQALAPTRLLLARFSDIQDLYSRHKDWERIGRLLAENLVVRKARREWEFMTLSAEERYLALLQRHPELEGIPQYHLASYLGISPVSLSRIRRRLGKPRLR